LLFGWVDIVDVGINALVLAEEDSKLELEAAVAIELCVVGFEKADDDRDERDAEVDVGECKDDGRVGYIVERMPGGGAENVSSVGCEQLAEPSGLVLQQRQIWPTLS